MTYAHPDVQIKKYKTFRGHESEPLAQGDLYFRGKKIIEWSDDSWGGPLRVEFVDAKGRILERASQAFQDTFAAFASFAKERLDGTKNWLDEPYDVKTMADEIAVEAYVERLSSEFGERKELETATKKGQRIVYVLGGETYQLNRPYTQANVAALRAKHPEITEIVNETLGQAFLAEADAQAAEDAAWLKRVQAKCKKHLVAVIVEDGKKVTKIFTQPHSADYAQKVRAHFGANLVEIVNDRFLR